MLHATVSVPLSLERRGAGVRSMLDAERRFIGVIVVAGVTVSRSASMHAAIRMRAVNEVPNRSTGCVDPMQMIGRYATCILIRVPNRMRRTDEAVRSLVRSRCVPFPKGPAIVQAWPVAFAVAIRPWPSKSGRQNRFGV